MDEAVESPFQQCLKFFDLMFSGSLCEARKLTVFTVPNKVSRRFTNTQDAAKYATSQPNGYHVYHGVGTVDSPASRGTASEIKSISAVWCDVDIYSDAHQSEKLPKSIDEAIELIESMPLAPTLIVHSGNGLHGYWIFDEPWIFSSDSDRAEAARIAKGWHGLICEKAKDRGWEMENLGDLPRVLRTPGTVNPRTGQPVVVHQCGCEVYSRQQFIELLKKEDRSAVEVLWTSKKVSGSIDLIERVGRYLDKIPGAIAGSKGGTQTLLACKALFRFGLDDETARKCFERYNARCKPKWENEKEIAHKLADAKKSVIAEGSFGSLVNSNVELDAVDLSRLLLELSDACPEECETQECDHDRQAVFPSDCLNVDGLLMEIIDYNLATALYPQPELALAAAIAVIGTITGRKVCDAYGTRTNVLILGLGLSGTGKEHARKVNKELLLRSGCEKMIGSERVGSHAGIVTAVSEQPATLLQLDEIGRMLETCKDPRRSPHLYSCITVLMQLYTSSSTLWKADAYADSKKVKTIDQPHLCMYGTATPDSFWHSLSTENIGEGLMGRLMVFEGRGYETRMQRPSEEPLPATLVEAFRWWHQFAPGGNLGGEHPAAHRIPHTPEASSRYETHTAEINDRRIKEDHLRAAVWSRSGEKANKLALIHACSRARGLPSEITLQDIDWGIRLANFLTRRLLLGCGEHVSENEIEARAKRVLRLIGNGISANELARKTQWLRGRERLEILADLIGCGMVVSEQLDTTGRPKTVYRRSRKQASR